jgi:uncharacterized protein (TIGR03437 family)
MRMLRFLAFLFPVFVYAQPQFMIQDLGTLPNMPSCTGTAISQSGQVTGYCSPAGGSVFLGTNTRGFLYTGGKMMDLGQATSSAPLVPTGVNDSGVVVGSYVTISLLTGLSVAPFIYQNGAIQGFHGVPNSCAPFGLNNGGQAGATNVLGGDNIFVSSQALQLSTAGTSTVLAPSGGAQGAAFGVSPSGAWIAGASAAAVGSSVTKLIPTLWNNGKVQALPLASGFTYTTATGVNDSGMASGMGFTFDFNQLMDPNASSHAVMMANGATMDLGTLPGDVSSAALAINNSGSVVGFSSGKIPDITLHLAPFLETASSSSHAFVYANGKMYDLTRQLVNGTGWQLTSAVGINDAGQIAGTGVFQQQQHAFLLTPVSGPQLNSVVGAGLSVPAVDALSANGLFTLFGTGFAGPMVNRNVTGADLTNNALPTNLANTCVEGGGTRWGIIYVSALQINAVANPTATSGTVPVSVISNCDQPNQIVSAAVNVNVAAQTPQFLFDVQNPNGQNEIVAVEAASGAKVGPAGLIQGVTFTPAQGGDTLTAYGVGWGATTPAAVVGSLAAAAANITGDFTLTVGGKPAKVLYAGLTPTYAGLYQINFIVPTGLTPGNQPIVLNINGVPTPTGAFLAVQ